tara:strand:+ start:1030 stop:1209 length:180 start_codon:yes stop_codon:yes gene_type:complete
MNPNITFKFYTKKELYDMPNEDFKRIYSWLKAYVRMVEFISLDRELPITIEEAVEIINK